MTIRKSYAYKIRNDEGQVTNSGHIWEGEVESVDGIGNWVESISHLLGDNETLEITACYHE